MYSRISRAGTRRQPRQANQKSLFILLIICVSQELERTDSTELIPYVWAEIVWRSLAHAHGGDEGREGGGRNLQNALFLQNLLPYHSSMVAYPSSSSFSAPPSLSLTHTHISMQRNMGTWEMPWSTARKQMSPRDDTVQNNLPAAREVYCLVDCDFVIAPSKFFILFLVTVESGNPNNDTNCAPVTTRRFIVNIPQFVHQYPYGSVAFIRQYMHFCSIIAAVYCSAFTAVLVL